MRHGRPRGGEARRGRGRCNHLAGRVRNGASPPSWAYRHAALHVSARWRSLTAVLNAIGRRGVGTLEQRQRWWVHWLETLSMRAFPLCGPWCHAASIAFGLSGAFVRAAPGICCGSRIQFHLARGQLRLQPTTIRVVPSCTWVASLLVRHDRRRGLGQVSASLHASRCTPESPVNLCAPSCLQPALAGSQVAWFVLAMACRAWAPCSTLSLSHRTPMHFIASGGCLCSAVTVDAHIVVLLVY